MRSWSKKEVTFTKKSSRNREQSSFQQLKHLFNNLRNLEELLSEKELALVTLECEISAFDVQYYRAVGKLLVELDQLEAQIAEILAKQKPEDSYLKGYAQEQRRKAEQSAYQYSERESDQSKKIDFKPSEDIKQLYRKVAKCLHPDLATDDTERKRRTVLMQEVNKAYSEGDQELLQLLLIENELGDEIDLSIERHLELLSSKITFVNSRLELIEQKMNQIYGSSLYLLMIRVREAAIAGIDLLSQMADDLVVKIKTKRRLLHKLLQSNQS